MKEEEEGEEEDEEEEGELRFEVFYSDINVDGGLLSYDSM